ncbi:MAG TPA: hypothetical protein ENN43_02420 [bacterium]|nr:hypothetical protein [bacterium]
MIRGLAAAVLCGFLFFGCSFLFVHDPEEARQAATRFIDTLYIKGDFEALPEMMLKESVEAGGVESVKQAGEMFKRRYKKLDGIKAGFYLIEGRVISVFYMGLSEEDMSYHRVILTRGKDSEYLVKSASFSETPYTGYRTAQYFKN